MARPRDKLKPPVLTARLSAWALSPAFARGRGSSLSRVGSQDATEGRQCPQDRASQSPVLSPQVSSLATGPPAMDGTASLSAAGRPQHSSAIPMPRAASQSRTQTPASSPQLRPRQAGLALSPQRAVSPRLGKTSGPSRGSSPKAPRGRGSPKAAGAPRELSVGVGAPNGSPWSSPHVAPKATLASRARSRRAGETRGTPGQKRGAQEGTVNRQTRGRSPSRASFHGDTQLPGTPEVRKPSSHPGKDQRDVPGTSHGTPRPLEPEPRAASGPPSPACSPVRSPRPGPGAVSFGSAHPHGQPVTATVAPFRYR